MHGRPHHPFSAPTRRVTVDRVGRDAGVVDDVVAVEQPLEIRLGCRHPDGGRPAVVPVSVTMRTPGHDAELAVGFLHAEGIIRRPEDVIDVGPCGTGIDRVVRVDLADSVAVDWARLQRFVTTTSSCGVCGKTSLDALQTASAPDIPREAGITTAAVIRSLPARLVDSQAVFRETGGLHAAAAFTTAGELLAVREDVGRHNALDKLVGWAWQSHLLPWHECVVLLSGRASFELLQKAAMAGIPLVAAVGAPSSLAVELADEHGITLCGFVRDDRFNIYTAGWRVSR